ncbi:MAG: cupin domain-containing protein, partial [Proteobacteria bacterium]|nr:cupin domain-containing protein [Pseudomonadota bacterium]
MADKIEAAHPTILAQLVDYATGAIVSRTLEKTPGGTLTVFAFDTGEELSEHTAPFNAYITVLDGSAELTIGGQVVNTAKGETVLMPADVPHAVRAVERFKMLLMMV